MTKCLCISDTAYYSKIINIYYFIIILFIFYATIATTVEDSTKYILFAYFLYIISIAIIIV